MREWTKIDRQANGFAVPAAPAPAPVVEAYVPPPAPVVEAPPVAPMPV